MKQQLPTVDFPITTMHYNITGQKAVGKPFGMSSFSLKFPAPQSATLYQTTSISSEKRKRVENIPKKNLMLLKMVFIDFRFWCSSGRIKRSPEQKKIQVNE